MERLTTTIVPRWSVILDLGGDDDNKRRLYYCRDAWSAAILSFWEIASMNECLPLRQLIPQVKARRDDHLERATVPAPRLDCDGSAQDILYISI